MEAVGVFGASSYAEGELADEMLWDGGVDVFVHECQSGSGHADDMIVYVAVRTKASLLKGVDDDLDDFSDLGEEVVDVE